MRRIIFILFISSFVIAQQKFLYQDKNQSIENRVDDLIERITLKEKIDLLGGTGFVTKQIDRLGIPELRMTDGPVGVRWGDATAFPVSIAMAATWDPNLVYGIGSAIGRETKGKARHVILGPCVNIARLPMGGRNFESFGEDPFLASRMTVEYIKGVQSEGVAATIKHFAANNQEHERLWVDVLVGERALNEIYLPAFKAAVTEADVLCVMSAYNKVNRHYASENDYLLIDKLKKEWGFNGLVMSDWGAVHSSLPTVKGGLDLEMPVGMFMNNENILKALEEGQVDVETIDEKVRRILRVIFKLGLLDTDTWRENDDLINSSENRNAAYETSLTSIVLLKNDDNVLPIQKEKIKTVGIIGPNAKVARTGGGGSALISPIDPVSPFDGLKAKLGKDVKIEFAQGVRLEGDANAIESKFLFQDEKGKKKGLGAEYFDNKNLAGEPKVVRVDENINFRWHGGNPVKGIGEDNFSARWSGYLKAPKTGNYILKTSTDDGARLYIDDQLVINDWNDHAIETRSCSVFLEEGKHYKLKMEYYENGGGAIAILGWNKPGNNLFDEAVAVAKKSDYILLFVGNSDQIETEGRDRNDLTLPSGQDDLIRKVSEVNNNVVVVLSIGSPVLINKWIANVKGVVVMWFAGSEGGNAIADILLGNYNPSGKLPITFPKRWEDCSAYGSYKAFPSRTYYSDDIYVGYRHFDKNEIEPLFPFGYGLSYTTFDYSNLNVTPNGEEFIITFDLKNTGDVEGSEAAQLYVGVKNSKVDRPKKELKAFAKVMLAPGEQKKVTMSVAKNALAYFDSQTSSWIVEENVYEFIVGGSSRDLKLKTDVDVK